MRIVCLEPFFSISSAVNMPAGPAPIMTTSFFINGGRADGHVEGLGNTEEVKEIRKRAIQAGLKLVDCPIRHLGTEKAQLTVSMTSLRTSTRTPMSTVPGCPLPTPRRWGS